MRKSALPSHGICNPLSILTVASQFPICRSLFARKWNAFDHLCRSAITNTCHFQRSATSTLKETPKDFKCPLSDTTLIHNSDVCTSIGSSLAELQDHICSTHLWFSASIVYPNVDDNRKVAGIDPDLASSITEFKGDIRVTVIAPAAERQERQARRTRSTGAPRALRCHSLTIGRPRSQRRHSGTATTSRGRAASSSTAGR